MHGRPLNLNVKVQASVRSSHGGCDKQFAFYEFEYVITCMGILNFNMRVLTVRYVSLTVPCLDFKR